MRVVGGKWGGVPLESPEGRGVTRPTTDRNREAMASMILSARGLNLGGASVLDTPLYRYPTLSFAAQVLTVVGLGIARAAIDEVLGMAAGRAIVRIRLRLRCIRGRAGPGHRGAAGGAP